jgi:hypothetical protein
MVALFDLLETAGVLCPNESKFMKWYCNYCTGLTSLLKSLWSVLTFVQTTSKPLVGYLVLFIDWQMSDGRLLAIFISTSLLSHSHPFSPSSLSSSLTPNPTLVIKKIIPPS